MIGEIVPHQNSSVAVERTAGNKWSFVVKTYNSKPDTAANAAMYIADELERRIRDGQQSGVIDFQSRIVLPDDLQEQFDEPFKIHVKDSGEATTTPQKPGRGRKPAASKSESKVPPVGNDPLAGIPDKAPEFKPGQEPPAHIDPATGQPYPPADGKDLFPQRPASQPVAPSTISGETETDIEALISNPPF